MAKKKAKKKSTATYQAISDSLFVGKIPIPLDGYQQKQPIVNVEDPQIKKVDIQEITEPLNSYFQETTSLQTFNHVIFPNLQTGTLFTATLAYKARLKYFSFYLNFTAAPANGSYVRVDLRILNSDGINFLAIPLVITPTELSACDNGVLPDILLKEGWTIELDYRSYAPANFTWITRGMIFLEKLP